MFLKTQEGLLHKIVQKSWTRGCQILKTSLLLFVGCTVMTTEIETFSQCTVVLVAALTLMQGIVV